MNGNKKSRDSQGKIPSTRTTVLPLLTKNRVGNAVT
jgi:hypothetical protein